MAEIMTRTRSLSTFSLSLLYLSNLFLKSEQLNALCFVLMIVVMLLSLPVITGISRVIGYASLVLSAALFILYHAPIEVWKQALMGNLYLVALFTMVPILSIPIRNGGYYPALQDFFRRYVYTDRRYYVMVSFTSAFVGVLVNLAVVPLVYQIVQASEISRNKKLMSSAISRGFSTCAIWAPTTAAVALVIQVSGANWGRFAPLGILCGVISGVIGYAMSRFGERGSGTLEQVEAKASGDQDRSIERLKDSSSDPSSAPSSTPSEVSSKLNKIIELGAFSVFLIVAIAVISVVTGIQTVIVVSMAALTFPFLWMGLIGRLPVLIHDIKTSYFKNRLTKLSNEIVLFVGAGMLASSITFSELGNYIPMVLSRLVGDSAFLLAVVVVFGIVVLSALGVHPIIPITIIGGTIQGSDFGVTSTYIALLLGISWSMGITLSPTSATVITLSGVSSRTPVEVGLVWNGLYVLVTSSALIFVITGLRMMGLV